MLRNRLLDSMRAGFGSEPPRLRLVFPDHESYEFAPDPAVTITFHSAAPLKAMIKGDFARAADTYVAGDISVEGPIELVLTTGVALAEKLGRFPPLRGMARIATLLPAVNSKNRDAANISHHYDVGNEFYRLWLDELMVYSCAYFRAGDEDIHTAQRQKLDHICRKLLLQPGERLLDIGCGWGGLLRWAAERYGIKGIGVTLSERQYSSAREAVASSGLDDRLEIRRGHYLDLEDRDGFDKIVSVGMYEHVGLRNLPAYFQAVARLLRPGGAFLNHGIVSTDAAGRPRGPPGGRFIDRHVFPGGAVPHVSRVLIELSKAGLEFADAEDLRPHYALTLQHWSRRLEQCRDQAIEAAGPEALRIWRVFLAGMAYAFDHRWLSVAQVLSYKPLVSGEVRRPWTRDYQYRSDTDSSTTPISGKLEWT
ncbi:class I SAM-dependent methyltransferase [Bradyrhizobium sp.]|uniref:class I SAM-dependent methyltransferase n=1 Tax=Bradyrhizobium sp. TaxID=376 RepID=UPI0023A6D4CF|nr:class I SAM-dependent methyltransferase [Bradyrhizobium sp.]MDE1934739.1 class I SAM-dependent methyltransferase [Bradyrhizobium sp.]